MRSVLAIVLLLGGVVPAAAAPAPRLLSVEGNATVNGLPAGGPMALPPEACLTLAPRARAQLLLEEGAASLAISVLGPARLRVAAAVVEVLQGERLQASGSGQLRLHGLDLLELRDGTAVLHGDDLYLRRGSGALRRLSPSPLNAGARLVHALAAPPAARLVGGDQARRGLHGFSVAKGTPGSELLTELGRFSAPPWRPSLPRVSVAEVRRAERFSNEARRAERETASCGCTESRGSGTAPNLGTGPGLTPLERQATRLRVRVVGVPGAN